MSSTATPASAPTGRSIGNTSPTDDQAPRFACVIMASGLSRRFGANKLTASFCGQPLIVRALYATQGLFVARIVVTRHEDVAALCREHGASVLMHDLPDRSDTVRLGLSAAGDVDGCVFLPGDQPLLRRETVAVLIRAAAAQPDMIWRASHDGVPGSPVFFPKWAFGELLALPKGKGGGHVIAAYPERVRLMPVSDQRELMDVDTPQDLMALLRTSNPSV